MFHKSIVICYQRKMPPLICVCNSALPGWQRLQELHFSSCFVGTDLGPSWFVLISSPSEAIYALPSSARAHLASRHQGAIEYSQQLCDPDDHGWNWAFLIEMAFRALERREHAGHHTRILVLTISAKKENICGVIGNTSVALLMGVSMPKRAKEIHAKYSEWWALSERCSRHH